METINYIVNLGTSVMMPIIFFVLALAVGVKPGRAFKAALLIGIGFEGLTLVINLLLDNLGPAATAMTGRMGVSLTTLDSGWAVAATVGWGFEFMVPLVLMFIAINLAMVALKLTDTVDIDIFNYWIFLCESAIIYAASGSVVVTFVASAILFAGMLKLADVMAPTVDRQFGLEGISFPHLTCIPQAIFGIVVNWVFERIPGLKDLDLDAKRVSDKLGVLGDPATIGFILGAAIALLAGYDVGGAATLAVKVAAAMVLMPRMVGILLEGLDIVKCAVEEKLAKLFPDRRFFIGMDVALLVGDPCIIAVGVLLIPITLALAMVLPGNTVLPFVDLPLLIFDVTLIAAFCRKDMLRTLVAGTLLMVFVLFAANDVAGVYSAAAAATGATFPEGMDVMTALNVCFTNPLGWAAIKLAGLF